MSRRRSSKFIGDSSQFTHMTNVRESMPAEKNLPGLAQEIEAGSFQAGGGMPQGNPTCTARSMPDDMLELLASSIDESLCNQLKGE